jgi:hypothetical protein
MLKIEVSYIIGTMIEGRKIVSEPRASHPITPVVAAPGSYAFWNASRYSVHGQVCNATDDVAIAFEARNSSN